MTAKIIFLSLFFIGRVGATGGVDVGNGVSYLATFESPSFSSEMELAEYVRSIVPAVEDGSFPDVQLFQNQGDCDPNFSDFEGYSTIFYYPVEGLTLGERLFRGHVAVELQACERPEEIQTAGLTY